MSSIYGNYYCSYCRFIYIGIKYQLLYQRHWLYINYNDTLLFRFDTYKNVSCKMRKTINLRALKSLKLETQFIAIDDILVYNM